ncbi:MAG: hypothetical protein HUU09_04210 [Candidatus Jettenia caeni]|uniref:hypothetical protein n=1 Tax=Candidatus Jettenia sp. AMX1 TaxID=2293637 RepID=UPI0017E078BA|nr:hypothetical protein [Candidatus Jettenia sp. AMX1]NUN22656.1 hypothetical protein [Candidatus Jettenia caeni]WKZ16300.1 MAG: hypothetical protein QY317_03135 [Candidatus Jettenia caeni]
MSSAKRRRRSQSLSIVVSITWIADIGTIALPLSIAVRSDFNASLNGSRSFS